MTRNLPLLPLIPVTTLLIDKRTELIASNSGVVPKCPTTFNTIDELLTASLNGNTAADSAIEHHFRFSNIFTEWQKQMPYLKFVCAISKYRKSKNALSPASYLKVNKEIKGVAINISKGQTLYRGMEGPSLASVRNIPTSCTLLPSVAYAHAQKRSGSFCILECMSDIPVFVFSVSRNQKLSHEFEVLLAAPISFSNPRQRTLGDIQVTYLEITCQSV